VKVDKSEETQEQHAAIPASAGRAFPSRLSPAGGPIEIPVFLQGGKPAVPGVKADAVVRSQSDKPTQRVAPFFLGWTRYGKWTPRGLISTVIR
jgi:hypothetical protein